MEKLLASSNAAGKTDMASAWAARSAPNAMLWVSFIGISAAGATLMGILPGGAVPFLGAAAQGIVWACLYAGLGLAYRAFALKDEESARKALRKLGLCLLLALLSTYTCKRLIAPHLTRGTWVDLFYLRYLLPVMFIGFWCTALLPRSTLALYRSGKGHPTIGPLLDLAVLFVSAAVLVSCADFSFQRGGETAVEARLKLDIILASAWVTNTLILFSAYALVLAVTSRVTTGLLVVSPLYAAFGVATFAKIQYMHSAIQPLDLIRIPEFLPLFRSFFGAGVLVATVFALVLWIAALWVVGRMPPCRMSIALRWSTGLLSLIVLLAFPVAFSLEHSVPLANRLLSLAGAPDGQHREKARRNGLLLSFLSEIPASIVAPPPHYSLAAVASALRKYGSFGANAPAVKEQARVNLIVYVIESFMEPHDLGLRYTSEPTPNLRALSQTSITGHGIVPEPFGGSANTEFEVLTGMTRSFLPEGSLPYRQYLKHRIPSLPHALKSLGYATAAIQADPKYYYDRERAYGVLGFDRVVWLNDVPHVERAPRGGWPSDKAVVRAIIQASRRATPFFIFAFTSATHSPYNFAAYRNSDLDVIDPPSRDAVGEIKEYINALRDADRAIGMLIQHFQGRSERTMIAILGDHLPPLSGDALQNFSMRLSGASKAEQARMIHRVPLLLWANFDLPREEKELSTNALASYLLEKMGIPTPGFFALTNAVRLKIPVLDSYVLNGGDLGEWNSLSEEARELIEDYRLIQYDVLLGEQYSLRASASGGTLPDGCRRATSRQFVNAGRRAVRRHANKGWPAPDAGQWAC